MGFNAYWVCRLMGFVAYWLIEFVTIFFTPTTTQAQVFREYLRKIKKFTKHWLPVPQDLRRILF